MFVEHVECCGEPFKEEILKKVLELKNRDYKILTSYIEALKQSESQELQALNQIYLDKKFSLRKKEAQVDRNELVILAWIDQWRVRRFKRKVFDSVKTYTLAKSKV